MGWYVWSWLRMLCVVRCRGGKWWISIFLCVLLTFKIKYLKWNSFRWKTGESNEYQGISNFSFFYLRNRNGISRWWTEEKNENQKHRHRYFKFTTTRYANTNCLNPIWQYFFVNKSTSTWFVPDFFTYFSLCSICIVVLDRPSYQDVIQF